VKCSVVKCSESLSNRVSKIIRRYTDHMKFAAYMTFVYHILSCSFGPEFFFRYIYMFVCFACFCLIFVNYVFLLLCLYILIIMYVLLTIFYLHCVVLCTDCV